MRKGLNKRRKTKKQTNWKANGLKNDQEKGKVLEFQDLLAELWEHCLAYPEPDGVESDGAMAVRNAEGHWKKLKRKKNSVAANIRLNKQDAVAEHKGHEQEPRNALGSGVTISDGR